MKRALITGITGQDGPYLAQILLSKGYRVYGLARESSIKHSNAADTVSADQCDECVFDRESVELICADLRDASSVRPVIRDLLPDEVYNLAGQSHVGRSFDMPEETADVNALGTLRLLEAIREAGLVEAKFFQAASSHVFGESASTPLNEAARFHPRSPYAVSKAFAYWTVRNHREAYGMYAASAIMFNHESPRRSESFVTRKITRAAARIKLGLQSSLSLGNLDAKRDWGYARDYMEAAWLMLQQAAPDDYVIATGEAHSVIDFLNESFGYLGLAWQDYVETSKEHLRPSEAGAMVGDSAKARQTLGWEPKVRFKELVRLMVDRDLKLARKELAGESIAESGKVK